MNDKHICPVMNEEDEKKEHKPLFQPFVDKTYCMSFGVQFKARKSKEVAEPGCKYFNGERCVYNE